MMNNYKNLIPINNLSWELKPAGSSEVIFRWVLRLTNQSLEEK